jgi:hypothetical protein
MAGPPLESTWPRITADPGSPGRGPRAYQPAIPPAWHLDRLVRRPAEPVQGARNADAGDGDPHREGGWLVAAHRAEAASGVDPAGCSVLCWGAGYRGGLGMATPACEHPASSANATAAAGTATVVPVRPSRAIVRVSLDREVPTLEVARPGIEHGRGVELRRYCRSARQPDREEVALRPGEVPVVVPHDDLEAAQR